MRQKCATFSYIIMPTKTERGYIMKQRVFIDMDGVLCEYRTDADLADMETAGYFRNLRPRKKMLDAVRTLVKSGCADVFILSSVLPQTESESVREKNEWLDEFLPEIQQERRIFPLCGTNKADAVADLLPTDVLCDDHTPNLNGWVRSGGKAVKIINEVNGLRGTFTAGPRVKIETGADLMRAIGAA